MKLIFCKERKEEKGQESFLEMFQRMLKHELDMTDLDFQFLEFNTAGEVRKNIKEGLAVFFISGSMCGEAIKIARENKDKGVIAFSGKDLPVDVLPPNLLLMRKEHFCLNEVLNIINFLNDFIE